jgi:hypothetical protein
MLLRGRVRSFSVTAFCGGARLKILWIFEDCREINRRTKLGNDNAVGRALSIGTRDAQFDRSICAFARLKKI